MKIAVPVTRENVIDDHFGHCEFYNLYTTNKNRIESVDAIASLKGCGCKSDIANELAQKGVTVMLAGGIGNGAIQKLNASGITVIRGCSGMPEDNVNAYIQGNLLDSGESCQQHDQHNKHLCNH